MKGWRVADISHLQVFVSSQTPPCEAEQRERERLHLNLLAETIKITISVVTLAWWNTNSRYWNIVSSWSRDMLWGRPADMIVLKLQQQHMAPVKVMRVSGM